MKRGVRSLMLIGAVLISMQVLAQKEELRDERMNRDLEVAENILETLIKQKLEKRSFFPVEIESDYREGYGVTFRLPLQLGANIWSVFSSEGVSFIGGGNSALNLFGDDENYSVDWERATVTEGQNVNRQGGGKVKSTSAKSVNVDSIREQNALRVIEAAKDFIADYGDLISMPASEKITITNRGGDSDRIWFGARINPAKPSYISVEASRGDVSDFRQGKITREALLKKIKVVNGVFDDELKPDLELLTSIFNRLYQRDLSKTFFTDENIYYERLKDYGVIYYLNVYSSNQLAPNRWVMPTQGLNNLSQEDRDKKVKELYPIFERDIKADMLEYGRTLRSLNRDESLVFNITLTKCKGCGIPATLELVVKAGVLSDYAAGKISKDAALAKIELKRGNNQ